MRIVGGSFRGRPLKAPKGDQVRPTSDRTRESIFNILVNGPPTVVLHDACILDVFAGTGALGLEALSRGAALATFLDNSGPSLASVEANAAALGVTRQCLTLKLDAGRLGPPPKLMEYPAGVVFLDPPYGQDLAAPSLAALAQYGWLAEGAVVVVETGSSQLFDLPAGYELIDSRIYGVARISFLKLD